MKLSFNLEDASQVTIGAFALAVPISFSEEAGKLGETLPGINLLMLFILSIALIKNKCGDRPGQSVSRDRRLKTYR